MTRLIGVLVFLTMAAPAGAEQWKLVWSDEFDRAGLPDSSKWDYEHGFLRNNEKQFYTKARQENARVEGGKLVIEARKEEYSEPVATAKAARRRRQAGGPAHYTSASLTTRGKAAWRHGRIEVRAKLPRGRGVWPAIWCLGTDIDRVGWPACGEIDIMEFVGFDPGVIHANVHTKKYNHVLKTNKGAQIRVPDASEAFHVYSVEWDAEQMRFSVDGKEYFTFRNEGAGRDAWPYDAEQYLILNLAIGGDWGGRMGIDDGIFPQKYEIDYVRVYQKKQRAGPSEGRTRRRAPSSHPPLVRRGPPDPAASGPGDLRSARAARSEAPRVAPPDDAVSPAASSGARHGASLFTSPEETGTGASKTPSQSPFPQGL